MRQHNFVFDVDNLEMGIARATCSLDPNQIISEQELILAKQRYALDPTHTESLNEECTIRSGTFVQRPARIKHDPNPQPKYVPTEEEIEEPIEIGYQPEKASTEV